MPREKCGNCNGTGTVTYRYGPPGTDLRETPVSEVEWSEPTYRECKPCEGTGERYVRPPARTGTVYFTVAGDVDHERTVNEAHRQSRGKGNQGWQT